jgi:branched-chain amino acid transport system ATP-binding protein
VLKIENLYKRFGGLVVTHDVNLTLIPGELHALIGPNGAGKTTLVNQLAGEIEPSSGRILLEGADITAERPWQRALRGIGRSFQISSVFHEFTALQNVLLAAQPRRGHSFRFWHAAESDAELVKRARQALEQAGLGTVAEAPVSNLSHGQKRQLELAMTLVGEPRLLLLDEPMAGMSPSDADAVIAMLRGLKGLYTVVLIEHDMDAVFALADRISVLFYGQILVTGTVDEIRSNQAVRDAYLGHEERTPA